MASVIASVSQGLVSRIYAGSYPVGSMLPGCRVLAQELGVNKNTVTRAFQALQEQGLIRSVPGVGMMVVRIPDSAEQANKMDIMSEISGLIRRARALGINRKEVEQACRKYMDRWYSTGRLHLALVECNMWDARSLATDIESRLGISVAPMLLEDFMAKPDSILLDYDLVLTTFYHLTEMYNVVSEADRGSIVALGDHPSVKSLLALSNIPQDARIAVVAAHERTVKQLERTLESCGRKAKYAAVLGDPNRVKSALRQATVVVESERCHTELEQLGLSKDLPLVTVSFEIDLQSFGFLQKKVERLMARSEVSAT